MGLRTYFFLIAAAVGLSGFMTMVNGTSSFGGDTVVTAASSSDAADEKIPDQAIRLRILANSDNVRDQGLKRKVRDAVLDEMGSWVHRPANIHEARRLVRSQLPEFEKIAKKTIQSHGYDYSVKVKFGKVPFPTKLYGNRVYPAGEYEALLITIGEGKGDNWWCVLFPPLCFVDMSNSDALPAKGRGQSAPTQTAALNQAMAAPAEEKLEKPLKPTQPQQQNQMKVRFFFLDSLEDFFSELFG
jgi:stage II sporulation protein R